MMLNKKQTCLFFATVLFSLLLLSNSSLLSKKLPVPERGFISSQPAETWEQGLISGNGTIGANVLSRPLDETIIFTHERLFMPMGPPKMPPDSSARLFEIRNLIERGLYHQATQLAFDFSEQTSFMYPDPFVPAFDMNITTESQGRVRDYMRSVDFETGEATVHWADDRGVFERRLFVSRADGVAALLITGPKPGAVNCRLKLTPRNPSNKLETRQVKSSAERFKAFVTDIKTTAEQSGLTWRNSFTNAYPGSIHALEGMAHVVAKNGLTQPEGETLIVTGADSMLVLVDIEVIYDPDRSTFEDMKNILSRLGEDYHTLLQKHKPIHGEMFMRMRLDIGGGEDHKLTTEKLLTKTTNANLCKALIEKEFDAGRYNIISCTGQLPPTLQGVWGGTYVPGWASDFTHNGNVPSAIASMLMANTPELMLAYTSYIESIVPYLQINAKHMFGARGIVLPSRSTTNGFNNALAPRFAGGFWVAGAAWAAHFFYDYYLYTGDRQFLADHALPFMEKAALFFEDYLYEGPDGKYIFSPTQSPENTPGNTDSQGSFNATMDVAAAKELLHNLISASRELGTNQDKIPLWQSMLKKMPDYMIGPDGALKEWLTPKLHDQHNHRHTSQLYPLYDGMPEEIARDPKLQAAFKRIIEIKLDRHWKEGSGFMSFGLVQLGQAAATLGESDMAYKCLVHLVNRYWLHNLASMHNHKSLFNMDISGGMPAVIIKMLAASDPGRIQLLPALPKAWPSGTIEGILCRGQIEIKSLNWDKNQIKLALISAKKQSITLETPSEIKDVSVKQGNAKVKTPDRKNHCTLALPAQQEITLTITLANPVTHKSNSLGPSLSHSAKVHPFPDKNFYHPVKKQIEGWTVSVDPRLLEPNPKNQCAMDALANHLQRINYIMPPETLKRMHGMQIWVEVDNPALAKLNMEHMQYHPDRNWLIDNGLDPRLEKHVHIPKASNMLNPHMWAKHPYVVLHELSHAYHDRLFGYDDPRILKCYNNAMEKGLYKKVLLYTGENVPHYAATNQMEYFAEATEAYFGVNDFYPFVRAELKEYDPDCYALMENIWGKIK
jgi:hypothetical protein